MLPAVETVLYRHGYSLLAGMGLDEAGWSGHFSSSGVRSTHHPEGQRERILVLFHTNNFSETVSFS